MQIPGKVWIAPASIAGAVLIVSLGRAQAPPAPSFEVAAIRSASFPTPDTIRSGQFRAGMRIDGASLDFEFVTLADLLPYAYRVKDYQVAGPDWMRETRWDIQAKLPAGASQDQAPEMMQGLLADRFKLTIHHENRGQPVYALVLGKGGPKMEAAAAGDTKNAPTAAPNGPDTNGNDANGGAGGRGFFLGGGGLGGGPFGGGNVTITQDGRGGGRGAVITGGEAGTTRISPSANCGLHLEFTEMTMAALADTLTPFLDKPVVDATGLKGAYKASLELPLEVMFAMMQNMMRTSGFPPPGQFGRGPGGDGPGGPGGRGFGGGPGGGFPGCADPAALFAGGGADVSNAAIFQAVQQLGLRLEARKAPFDTIVVDHLEKTPTEN